jgi:LysM repeat protein
MAIREVLRGSQLKRQLVAACLVAATAWAFSVACDDDDGPDSGGTTPAPTTTAAPLTSWPEREYAKLRLLAGGLSREYFRDVLGTPLFTRSSFDEEFFEDTYRGDGYWVQAVSNGDGGVEFMTVTSCDSAFRPTLEAVSLPGITLQETRLADRGEPWAAEYRGMANTANRIFVESYYLGNPGNYKTYMAGFNDACVGDTFQASDCEFPFVNFSFKRSDPAADDSPLREPQVAAFRSCAPINLYGDAGPFFDEASLDAFQVGADRILTRTAPPSGTPTAQRPTAAASATSTPITDAPSSFVPLYQVYTVAEGDTIASIAARFGIRAEYVIANNTQVEENLLALGQSLRIPAADGILHEVRVGETVADIAARYSVPVDTITSFEANRLTDAEGIPQSQLVLVPEARVPTDE